MSFRICFLHSHNETHCKTKLGIITIWQAQFIRMDIIRCYISLPLFKNRIIKAYDSMLVRFRHTNRRYLMPIYFRLNNLANSTHLKNSKYISIKFISFFFWYSYLPLYPMTILFNTFHPFLSYHTYVYSMTA